MGLGVGALAGRLRAHPSAACFPLIQAPPETLRENVSPRALAVHGPACIVLHCPAPARISGHRRRRFRGQGEPHLRPGPLDVESLLNPCRDRPDRKQQVAAPSTDCGALGKRKKGGPTLDRYHPNSVRALLHPLSFARDLARGKCHAAP
jgi:hypothetical protein